MNSGWTLGVVVGGGIAIVAIWIAVTRDAARVGVDRPRLWGAIVAGTCTLGLLTYLLVPTVPIPGLLVIVVAGPVFYLFEREDAVHGDEPADPRVLAGTGSPAETDEDGDDS